MAVMKAAPAQRLAPQPDPVSTPKVSVRAVLGDMHDPFTGHTYTQSPSPVEAEIKAGSWLDCQIQAGKLELC